MEAKSSLEYWEARWAEAPWSFATSWPDTYARLLELAFLKKQLAGLKGPVLDLGCGNLQLAEDNALLLDLASRGYMGIDGSAAALKVVEQRIQIFRNMDFDCEDFTQSDFVDQLEDWLDETMAAGYRQFPILLTKRTLQNLRPEERKKLWPALLKAEHGILIEGTEEGLKATSEVCVEHGLDACAPPAFNWYLDGDEVQALEERGAKVVPFMSHYYYHTRGIRRLKEWDSWVHRTAYQRNMMDMASDFSDSYTGSCGPVVAIVW